VSMRLESSVPRPCLDAMCDSLNPPLTGQTIVLSVALPHGRSIRVTPICTHLFLSSNHPSVLNSNLLVVIYTLCFSHYIYITEIAS
jgi:hypothetical protein